MRPVWLTVDTDDLRHTPSSQGHPTRSKGTAHEGTSPEMKLAMKSFREWLDRTQVSLTMFVIADQLDDGYFATWLKDLLENHDQVTIACHGLTHKCWSAYPKDEEGFLAALVEADVKLHKFAKDAWKSCRGKCDYSWDWLWKFSKS